MQNKQGRTHLFHTDAAAVCYPRRRIAIVGNAPPTSNMAEPIDSADFVIRFNKPQAFGAEYGQRVDLLCLINSGGQVEEWLRERTLTQQEFFKSSRSILFPNDPEILDRYHPKSITLAHGSAFRLSSRPTR